MTAVGQVNDFRDGRWYEDPATGARLEAVTSILGATNSKPWLTDWAANLAARWTVDHLPLITQTIAEAGADAAFDLIKGAAKRKRDRARDLGSDVHHVIEALLLDAPLPTFEDRDLDDDQRAEIENVAIGFLNFLQDWDVADSDVEMSEATAADPALGIAGTLDLIMRLRVFGRVLIDAKSGAHLDPSMAAQLAAYRDMTEIWLPTGLKRRMPKVDGCAILHLRPEHPRGYKLVLLREEDLDQAREWFHRMLAQYQTGLQFRKMPTRVIYPPLPDGSQPPPMLEDIEGAAKWCNVLRRHGYVRLDDLCKHTGKELLALKGFGPKSLDSARETLALHNLALSGEATAAAVA